MALQCCVALLVENNMNMDIQYNTDPYRRATYVGRFEVSVLAHVALRVLAAIFLASQWHFLANKHAVLAGCSAFWPVNCIFLQKKNEDTLHRWVALLLLIFILWYGWSYEELQI